MRSLANNILSVSNHRWHYVALNFWNLLKYLFIPFICLQACHTGVHQTYICTIRPNPWAPKVYCISDCWTFLFLQILKVIILDYPRDCGSVCPSVFSWMAGSLMWLFSKFPGSYRSHGPSICPTPCSSVSSSLSKKPCWSHSSWPSHTSIPESPVKRRYLPGVESLLGLKALWGWVCVASGVTGSPASTLSETKIAEWGQGDSSGGSVGGGAGWRGE